MRPLHYVRIGRLLHLRCHEILQVNVSPSTPRDSQGRVFDSLTNEFDAPMLMHIHYLVDGFVAPMQVTIGFRDWMTTQRVLAWITHTMRMLGDKTFASSPASLEYDLGTIPGEI